MSCKLLSVFLLVFMFDKISTFPEEHQIKADGRLEGMFNTLSQEVTSLKKLWANDVTMIKGQITRLEKQMYLLQESTVSGFTQRHRRAAHLPCKFVNYIDWLIINIYVRFFFHSHQFNPAILKVLKIYIIWLVNHSRGMFLCLSDFFFQKLSQGLKLNSI